MKIILTSVFIALCSLGLNAQVDTTAKVPDEIIEIYDVVMIYRETTDGRGITQKYTSELKGEILKYDETTGLITFKDLEGRMYSFRSEDYKYFQYDKQFTSKKKKQNVINPRKDAGFEFSAGLSFSLITIRHNFTPDAYYVNGMDSDADIPISLKVGMSKYLNKNSLVGITAEYSLFNAGSTYLNAGARYQFLYNPTKNAAFYFPVELKYSYNKWDHSYQTSDTTFYDPFSWSSTSDLDTEITINALELNFGQGISFSLKNKRSVALEMMLLKQFILSDRFKNTSSYTPNSEFGVAGVKLSLFMNF